MKMKGRWGRYWLLLICTAAMLGLVGCGDKEAEETVSETQITVETAVAQLMDISKSADYTGLVAGKNEVDVLSQASARVTAIYVQNGDSVAAGQTLVMLDTSDYVNSVALAQDNYQQALAGKKSNEVNLQTAQNTYERVRKLHESGAASEQDLENAQSAIDLLSTGSADVAVSIAETNLKNAQNQLAKCTIKSPIAGVIGSIDVTNGEMMNIGSEVAVITNTVDLEVAINVSEGDISYLQKGKKVAVYIQSAREEAFDGTISSIAAVSEADKAGYSVKIDLQNVNGLIKSGMFAKVVIDTKNNQQTLVLPVDAVISKAGQDLVYIINEEGRAHQIEVTTGISNEEYIEITSGMEVGQQVITSGNTLVSEGSKVKVVNEGAI